MSSRFSSVMPRIFFLLILLLERRDYISNEATPLHAAEAFSVLPQTATRPRRMHNTNLQTTNKPRNSSTSMAAFGTSFGSANKLPKVGRDGLYHITTEEEYRSILTENPDKLIIVKVFSPWCKTCKAMAPKFHAVAKRVDIRDAPTKLPIVWVSLAHSKEICRLVKSELGVSAVPSVVFHAGDGEVVDSFRCGPSKVATVLRPKLADLIAKHVDHSTGTLKTASGAVAVDVDKSAESMTTSTTTTTTSQQPAEQQGWNIRSKFRIAPLGWTPSRS
eukprot:CAMPEP_0116086690 /NCGR_PEP_ID=MMETSP0327-20121206/4985_1 /TAXON_ID=44447 /ORGANISM="Pseudo-nitzschia delicatissima, Strain B596" /LENGTH=274 /DNA_ID=CAMNT_0003577749 /DNA_START=146 /DNA_END=970 /DNA_ORIENTATION=+